MRKLSKSLLADGYHLSKRQKLGYTRIPQNDEEYWEDQISG
jgi:hypothetical protein